jgi:hypothetical protein
MSTGHSSGMQRVVILEVMSPWSKLINFGPALEGEIIKESQRVFFLFKPGNGCVTNLQKQSELGKSGFTMGYL